MKKVMQLLIAVAVLCSSLPFGAFAEDSADTGFDTGVLTFDDATDAAGIEKTLKSTGYLTQDAIFNVNGETAVIKPHKWDDDSGFGTSVAIENKGGYPGIHVMACNPVTGNIAVEFSIKKSDLQAPFYCCLNIGGSDRYVLVFKDDGYVYLCDNKMVKYESNTWYNVRLAFNPEKKYMQLSLKKPAESEWNVYGTIYNQENLSAGIGYIDLGYLAPKEETTYIDNVRYYTKGAAELVSTMTLIKEDFSSTPDMVTNSGDITEPARQWLKENMNGCTVELKQVGGKQALALKASAGSKYATITKKFGYLNLPENVTSVIKFGLGRSTNKTQIGMTNGAKYAFSYMPSEDGTQDKLNGLSGSHGMDYYGVKAGEIQDYVFVYNKAKGISRVLVAVNGRYYSNDTKDSNGAETIESLNEIGFQMPATDVEAEMYISDFSYYIVDDADLRLENVSMKSGNSVDAAALDDAIVFEFNQPVVQPKNTDGITCVIKDENGNVLENPNGGRMVWATFSQSEPNKITVATQAELDINRKYTVELQNTPGAPTVEGIQGAYSSENKTINYTFTTAVSKYEFKKPVMENGTIKLTGKSAYYQNGGKKAVLIAAAYDANGVLIGTDSKEISATKSAGETFEFTPDFGDKNPAKIKAFVLNGLDNIKPYTEAYSD